VKSRWLADARDEYREPVAYLIDEAGVGVARNFVRRVGDAARMIEHYPSMGTPLTENLHRLVVRGYPYDLVYRLEVDYFSIVALAHQRRRPKYWKQRR